jgi:hypothetical protein
LLRTHIENVGGTLIKFLSERVPNLASTDRA